MILILAFEIAGFIEQTDLDFDESLYNLMVMLLMDIE